MAELSTKKLLEKAMEEITNDDNILFMDDVVAACGVSKPTFYKYIKKGSEEYEQIWAKIQDNRIKVKKVWQSGVRKGCLKRHWKK